MTKEEQIIFDRVKEDLSQGSFEISIEFNSLRDKFASIISKEVCRLAINTMSNDNDIIGKLNQVVLNINEIEERLSVLENKRPEYVPPPVYGPITRECPTCGIVIQGSEFHVCSNSPGIYGRTDK